jgi:23S rRNA pseudouridine955/2504/2580 synthase/23S rRNA pseudouridine1911/1915/1917 synthase
VKERWRPDAPTALSVLHDLWRARDPAAPRPFVVHRLDKETSGLLLFGRDAATARSLSEAFRKRRVRKEYLALVAGSPPEPSGEVELRLLPDPRKPERMLVEERRGKKSVTAWETEELFRGWTLLRVVPRTGRTHQIRATLAHLGCAVVADPLYGQAEGLRLSALKRGYKRPRGHAEIPLLGRLALHAHRLLFEDPAGGGPILLEAAVPKDLRVALEKLRRYARPRDADAL